MMKRIFMLTAAIAILAGATGCSYVRTYHAPLAKQQAEPAETAHGQETAESD